LRQTTERPEAVEAGTVKLVGITRKNIIRETNLLLHEKKEYEKMANAVNPYGDGKAAERILNGILNYFGLAGEMVEEFARRGNMA
jgi:UDP-N-acetylglucosamine 2-epimerase (non-hydrolysing)